MVKKARTSVPYAERSTRSATTHDNGTERLIVSSRMLAAIGAVILIELRSMREDPYFVRVYE